MTGMPSGWKKLRAETARYYHSINAPCWLCHQPIDYTAAKHEPDGLDIDHVKPRATHPHLALDPGNLRPAHVRCNRSRGTRDPQTGLGDTSEDW